MRLSCHHKSITCTTMIETMLCSSDPITATQMIKANMRTQLPDKASTWFMTLNGVETVEGRADSGRKMVGEMRPKIGIGHSRKRRFDFPRMDDWEIFCFQTRTPTQRKKMIETAKREYLLRQSQIYYENRKQHFKEFQCVWG